jgi:hypothetical protein
MLRESGIGPLLQEIHLKTDYIQIRDKVSRASTCTVHVVELMNRQRKRETVSVENGAPKFAKNARL